MALALPIRLLRVAVPCLSSGARYPAGLQWRRRRSWELSLRTVFAHSSSPSPPALRHNKPSLFLQPFLNCTSYYSKFSHANSFSSQLPFFPILSSVPSRLLSSSSSSSLSTDQTQNGFSRGSLFQQTPALGSVQQTRSVTRFSKMGKRKTCKAVAKRFIRTGSGKLKYWPAGKVHNMLAKPHKKRRQLRKARYVGKTKLKTLNKMISGW